MRAADNEYHRRKREGEIQEDKEKFEKKELWAIKLKCDRGERGSLTKAKTTKYRHVRERESERDGGFCYERGRRGRLSGPRDRGDSLQGASVNDPPKWNVVECYHAISLGLV
ncbi:hypothetical protein AVEN_95269-1 [Araneus ventricosus]|uniref:Uncharacterized protein n=1 Tax=Araneus ventricosus TaxID=182803 RepID=A0A4Y2DHN5_ARAVE|nr:hypothetical protein AVEN_95269-1 [Araneus ventricosus]